METALFVVAVLIMGAILGVLFTIGTYVKIMYVGDLYVRGEDICAAFDKGVPELKKHKFVVLRILDEDA